MSNQLRVLLSTEGTYPFHQGGVSTWCDTLVTKMENVDFVIYSIIGNPFITQKFKLPANAQLQPVPLWGTEEPKEHLDVPFANIYLPKKSTTEEIVRDHFLPLFRQLMEEILKEVKNPRHLGQTLVAMYDYFQEYDYQQSFKSPQTWELYKELILRYANNQEHRISQPDVYGLVQSLGWVYRFLNIVNTPIPEIHVAHSSAAAFCGIPCVIAKLKYKTPFLLTEHGVYLREQYLSLSKRPYSSFLTTFLLRFVLSLTSLNYAHADQISPVCYYNTRWETRFGVQAERIKVIHNGVDERVFPETPSPQQAALTVVMVARIDPLKDIQTFLKAAALVRDKRPDVKFVVYGSISVPEYYEQCVELRNRFQLEQQFIFAGHTSNVPAAYQSGDIVVQTSISEGFPYSVIEAMMTGRPVIATDVGGTQEVLGETGMLVPPHSPEAVADALMQLLENKKLRETLGQEGRQRALNHFTLDKVIEQYLKSYIKLLSDGTEQAPVARRRDTALDRQKLLFEKGVALLSCGMYREAAEHMQKALQERANSPYTPLILTEISKAYNHLGEYDRSFQELEKYNAFMQWMEATQEIA